MDNVSPNSDSVHIGAIDPRSTHATSAMGEYFAELATRFSDGFEPGDTLTEDAKFFEAPYGAFLLIQESHDDRGSPDNEEVLGCGAVRLLTDEIAEIKRMWISAPARGRGLGRLLLGRLEEEATRLGARRVRLDTNSVLVEAIAMYESTGYQQIERYNDNPFAQRWFEKQLALKE